MNSEYLKLETAEKLVKYNRMVLEKKNIVRYLANQIALNKIKVKQYSEAKEKNLMIIAQARIELAKEILRMMIEEED